MLHNIALSTKVQGPERFFSGVLQASASAFVEGLAITGPKPRPHLHVVGKEPQEEPAAPQKPDRSVVTLADFYAYMPQHSYIFIPTREPWPMASVNARIPAVKVGKDDKGNDKFISASQWLDTRRPIEHMAWVPGEDMLIKHRFLDQGGWVSRPGIRTLNLYRPPTIILGDHSKADRFIELVHRVYPDDADHIILYMAHRVQRPGEKINHALVLGGSTGIGKDTILAALKQAVGPWNWGEVAPKEMLGKNNEYVKSVVLRINEARDLGEVDRYKFYDHMKTITASPPDALRCDEKYIRPYYVLNVLGVIYTTNYKTNGIFLPSEDRRHYVAWSELRKEAFADIYWNEFWHWYARESGFEQVTSYLMQHDLTNFDPKAPPPKTPAFWEIVNANRAPENAEIANVLDHLKNPNAVTFDMLIEGAENAKMLSFATWLEDRKNRKLIPHRLEEAGYLVVRNPGDKSDGRWKIGGRGMNVYARLELSVSERMEAAKNVTPVLDRKPLGGVKRGP